PRSDCLFDSAALRSSSMVRFAGLPRSSIGSPQPQFRHMSHLVTVQRPPGLSLAAGSLDPSQRPGAPVLAADGTEVSRPLQPNGVDRTASTGREPARGAPGPPARAAPPAP